MKEPGHYTDEDFQSYFDNTFTGNVSALESHVKECEFCSKKFKAYSVVWSFAKNDLKTKSLRIDLSYLVADKVFSVKENRYVFDKVMYGILICLEIVCLPLCLKFLLSLPIPSSFILMIVPVALFLWMSYREIRMFQKKFESYC